MPLRKLLQISPESWEKRNPDTFHQLVLLKMMVGSALVVILIPLYVTVFVRMLLDHIFVLQSLVWVVFLISYFRVRRDQQVYRASLVMISSLTALLLSILITTRVGDISGAYSYVVALIVAASFLLGPRGALPFFILFLGFFAAVATGLWDFLFPDSIPTLHPHRMTLYVDRSLGVVCAFALGHMFNYMKISQQERLKEREQDVAQKEKQLSINRMAGGIAHEINNPLTILLGYLELLEKHDFNKKDLERINPRIQMAAKRIQFVVWSLNQVNNDLNKRGGTADLARALQDVKLRVHDLSPKLNLLMDPATDIMIQLAAEDLQNLLYTVLENAAEALAHNADPSIHIKVQAVADFVQIEVWDNGDDINAADLPKFTDPFYSTKLDRPGRGMGLALAASIIHNVGGQLVFRRDGSWTIAAMTLPGQASAMLYAS